MARAPKPSAVEGEILPSDAPVLETPAGREIQIREVSQDDVRNYFDRRDVGESEPSREDFLQ